MAEHSDSRSSAGPVVVVGVEGSERSRDALALGDLLAAQFDGRLRVVHSHSYGQLSSLLGEGEYERLIRQVTETTFAQLSQVLGKGREREMQVISASSPAEGLQRAAEQVDAELIVVGSSHRSGLGRVRPGGVGERLLSGAPVPVAIAPREYADGERRLELIACAFDGSRESRLALEWAMTIARVGGIRLRVISVHTAMAFGHVGAGGAFSFETANRTLRRQLEQDQREALASFGEGAEGVIRDGDAAQELEVASEEADLLVMGSRGYGPLRAVVLGGVSSALVRNAACPVVVCPRGIADEPAGGE